MKKLLTVLCFILFAKLSFSQIVISGFLANSFGGDANHEYVQLVATENINFANNSYTVVFLNNGTATSKGWVEGNSTTYSFLLNSGTVNQGDVFYVGGDGKFINGSSSTDISSATWIRTINTGTVDGDIFGTKSSGGSLGNAGSSADGIGVFSGQLSTTDSTKKPIDCVFYGSSVGSAYSSSTVGYTVADNDFYNSGQGLFGEGTNTTLVSGGGSGSFTAFTGTFDGGSKTWTTKRTESTVSLSNTSVLTDIVSGITVTSNSPTITVNSVGFTNDFGFTYPNVPSSGSNFLLSGDKLTDPIEIKVNAPFEIRVGVNSYSSNTITRTPNMSGVVNNTVVDVRFNPTTTGVFEDTIFMTTKGGNTQIIPVKGTASNNPELSFQTTSYTIGEGGGSITVQVNISNANINSTSVDITSLSLGTATEGSDYTFTSPQTITFPSNSKDSITITIPIIDDNIAEGNETIYFTFDNATNGAVFSIDDTIKVTIEDNDYRKVNIGDIDDVDSDGVLDSLGNLYEITGKIYGYNQRSPGLQFIIRDQTGGLGTFGPTDLSYYSPSQGDSITIRGRLAQFRGLAQIDFIDTIIFHQSNQPLRGARVVTALDESTESDLVQFNNCTASGVWSSGNQWVYINGGNDSISVRVNPSSNTLVGKQIPSQPFTIIGIGGQFKFSSPFTSGYQLFPRDTNDIIIPPDSLSGFSLIAPANNASVVIQGAGTQLLNITWAPSQPAQGLLTPTYEFLLDVPTGDFSTPLITRQSNTGGTATALGLPYFQIADLLANQGIMVGQSLSLMWTVRATTTNNFSKLANQPYNITFTRDQMNSVSVTVGGKLSVYPNPAANNVFVEAPEAIKAVSITSIDGKVQTVQTVNGALKTTVNTSSLSNGIYIVSVETANTTYTHRLVIQK